MIAVVCLVFPALFLVLVRERVLHHHKSLYDSFVSYVLSVFLLNGGMILILHIFFHNDGQLFAKLNRYHDFAGKYFVLSMILALSEPFVETFLRKLFPKVKVIFDSIPKSAKIENVYAYLRQSIFLRAICAAEMLAFIWILAQCLRPACNLFLAADDLLLLKGPEECDVNLLKNGDDDYYQVSNEKETDDTRVLSSDFFRLYPGSYNVKITYVSDTAFDEGSSYVNSTGNLILESELHGHGIYFNFNDLPLLDSNTEESQTVQIHAPSALEDIRVFISFKGGGTLGICKIEITEIIAYKYMLLAMIILLFIFVDFIIVMFLKGDFKITGGGYCFLFVWLR